MKKFVVCVISIICIIAASIVAVFAIQTCHQTKRCKGIENNDRSIHIETLSDKDIYLFM